MAVYEICVAHSHFITPLDDKVFTATVMINCWCRDTYNLDINDMSLVTCNLDSILHPKNISELGQILGRFVSHFEYLFCSQI